MAQRPAKRQKASDTRLPTVLDCEWDLHKTLLKYLYIDKNMTVNEIRAKMLSEHNFSATQQQYQKRFRHWKLNKNISEDHWLSLSRALRKYGITLEELDSRHGNIDVLFEGHSLEVAKIKKAIYRYDTSLLNASPWRDDTYFDPVDELESTLRNLITRYIVKDQDNQLGKILPSNLIGIILGLSYTEESSSRLGSCTTWALKKRSTDLPTINLAQEEETVFTSCIASIADNTTQRDFFRYHEMSYLQSQWLKVLQETKIGFTPIECLSIWLDAASHTGQDGFLATNVLMFTLILCLLTEPCLRSGVMEKFETLRLLNVPLLARRPQSIVLLQILLLTMAGKGESFLCGQLIASGVDPNVVRPYSVPSHGNHISLTALQMSLGTGAFTSCKFESELVLRLLKAGADPNICGCHGQNQPARLICCNMLPIYLALKHPFTTFQALIDAGAYVPEGIDLTIAIQQITDVEILSALLPDKNPLVSTEGGFGRFEYERYLCPLQAVVALGQQELALRLLEKMTKKLTERQSEKVVGRVEPSLGCSLARLAQVLAGRCCSSAWISSDCSIFRTPLTYAILNNLPEVVDVLLARDADLSKSYFDYLPWSHSLRQKGLHFNSLSCYLQHTSASPLQAAVWDENFAAVQFALDTQLDPNLSFSIGISPLALAMWQGTEAITQLLKHHSARVSAEDIRRCVDQVQRDKISLEEQQETLNNDQLIMGLVSCRDYRHLHGVDPKTVRRKIRQTKKEIEEVEVGIEASEKFIAKLSLEIV